MIGQGDDFLCPITRKLMEDPVIAADGHTYSRSAIEEWILRDTQGAPYYSQPLGGPFDSSSRLLSQRGRRHCHP
jgi:hypothetical protein